MNFNLESLMPDIDQQWVWVLQIFIVILLTGLVSFILKRFLGKILTKLGRTSTRWDDILILALNRPLGWVVWLVGLDIAIDMIYIETQNHLFTYSDSVKNIGVLLCITWFFLGFVRRAEAEFVRGTDQVDQHTAEALGKLVRLAIMITAALVILQTLGFSVSGVLAMGGIGGIAIGFAAKDLLANFFGGLIVYLDRPFTIGDWIRSPDRKIEGTVEKIGWRVSVIRNFESQPIYIPNSVFTSIIVENPSRMENRRIYETIGLRYSDIDGMNKIVEQVKAMLIAREDIDSERTMMVNFNDFADSSVDFFIYCFTQTTKWVEFHQVKQEVMLQIAEIIKNNGAEIAFPTSTIHITDPVTVNS